MAGKPDSANTGRSGKPAGQPQSNGSASTGSPASVNQEAATREAVPAPTKETERKYLGKYKIERTLGQGGMGAVYLATDMELRRQVALKILPKDKAENPRLVKRFKAEAQAAAQLRHDNIVAVYEAGETDGQLYIALEFVDGNDVHALVTKRGVIPVKRSIDIITQVARALQHAWERKIVHRDIKPSNLMVRRDGVVKLADLGLARSIDETVETGITRAGTTVGTVDYMAPEQARDSKAADVRSDIYSLGCTWYQMLTGSCPYPDGSLTNKLHAHAVKPPPDPRDANPAVPDAVVAVMHRMMAKKPEDRYQNPEELLDDLGRATLGRENISNSVLAALANEDSAEALPTGRSKESAATAEFVAEVESPKSKPAKKGRESSRDSTRDTARDSPRDSVRESSADADDEPRTDAKPGRRSKGSSSSPVLPPSDDPRKKRTLDEVEGQKASGSESLKNAAKIAAIAALLLIALGGSWYIIRNLSNTLDGPGKASAHNPFVGESAEGATGTNPDVVQPDGSKSPNGSKDPSVASQNGPKPKPSGSGEGSQSTGDPPKNPDSTTPNPPGPGEEPGARISIGREAERTKMPSWVGSWIARDDLPKFEKETSLPVLTVGRDGDKSSKFATLAEAIDAVPKGGAMIRLVGEGPFFLRPTEIAAKTRLILAASPGTQPVVMLLPNGAGEGQRVLRVANMAIELIGVHLVAVARQFPSTEDLTLIDVFAGDISLRQSSITLLGTRPGSSTAIRISGEAVRPERSPVNSARVLLDRLVVRGSRLTAVALTQVATDFVASQCLFVPGESPVMTVREPAVPGAAAPDGSKARTNEDLLKRKLRFFSCTFSASKTGFDFQPADKENSPPATSVLLMNSLAAVDRPGANATFLEIGKWPIAISPGSDRPLFHGVQWDIPLTLFAGWDRLMAGEASFVRNSFGSAGWQQVWRQPVSESQFSVRPWPGKPVESPDLLLPGEIDPASLPNQNVKPEDGKPPGCPIAELRVPSELLLARLKAFADRPVAVAVVPVKPKEELPSIQFDANREDVGRAVSTGNWPSGAVIRIAGTGTQKSSPFVLKNRSVRLEFDSTLTLESRDLDYRGGTDAFVSSTGGNVEISGGRFRIPSSTKGDIPKYFFQIESGSFLMESCQIHGPMLNGPRFEAIIRWTRAAAPVKPLPAGRYEQYGRIVDSYAASFGKLVSADMRGRALCVKNTAGIGLNDLFDLDFSGTDGNIAAAVDLQDSTFSSSTGFFGIKGATLSQNAAKPLQIFADRCAFLSAVDPGNGPTRPFLLSYSGNCRSQRQLDWWGFRNGYLPEMKPWLRGEAEPSGEQDFKSHWADAWGEGHELSPLFSKGALLTKGGFKARAKVVPADFEIDAASPAGKWNNVGKAIGANIAVFADSESRPGNEKPDSKKPPKTTVVKPNF